MVTNLDAEKKKSNRSGSSSPSSSVSFSDVENIDLKNENIGKQSWKISPNASGNKHKPGLMRFQALKRKKIRGFRQRRASIKE